MNIVFGSHTPMGGVFVVGSHHLVRELTKGGHRVLHLSVPITLAHLTRWSNPQVRGRFRNWLNGGCVVDGGVLDYVPFALLPWPIAHRLGRAELSLMTFPPIGHILRKHGFSEVDVLLIDAPSLAGLRDHVKPKVMGYRATDLYSELRGISAIGELERKLVGGADFLIGTSALVVDRLKSLASDKPAYLLENGVDYELFSTPQDPPAEYREVPVPRLVYAGAFDERFGYGMVTSIAERLPSANLILIGPHSRETGRLLGGQGNVRLLGPRPHAQLPAYFQHADIGLLPLSDHPANDGRSPMKLFEYGASALPVVASRTQELARRGLNFVLLANNPLEFSEHVARLLSDPVRRSQMSAAAKLASASYSWRGITARLVQEICAKALDQPGT